MGGENALNSTVSSFDAIDAIPTLCDHVHLPVQSGSSHVLQMMAREYTREWYLERISWIKSSKRPISMTTDIIVGFPGETGADFEHTDEREDAEQREERPVEVAVGGEALHGSWTLVYCADPKIKLGIWS